MKRYIYIGILFLGFFSRFVTSYMVMNQTDAMMFLNRFGYIDMEDMMDDKMSMEKAEPMLMAFQKMCGINQTGALDTKTMEMMNAPRCGNKDMVRVPIGKEDPDSDNRIKRYMLSETGYKWKNREVTYRMGMFSEEMQKHVTLKDVLEAIHQAFRLWSEVTNLDFIYLPKSKKVDIELSFTSRNHPQDGYPFDGPGTVLAHAFPPGEGLLGDVHFEDEEEWRVHSPKGTDVLFVAVHEIGHALGLSHSSTKGAIMAAYYGGYRPNLKLHPDDIEGIQALYGKREISIHKPSTQPPPPVTYRPKPTLPPTTTTTTFRPPPITTTRQPVTTRPTIYTELPKTTSRLPPITYAPPRYSPYIPSSDRKEETGKSPKVNFGGRPDLCSDPKIDAITTIGGQIYLFKSSYVFQLDSEGNGVMPGSPNHISFIFKDLETNLDAVATRDNGKSYFFKGNKYWRSTGTKLDPGYPRPIAQSFKGIPDNIDSAFVMFGQFYFTKGDKFWRFNPKNKPNFVDPVYPLSIQGVWGLSVPRIDAAFMSPQGEVYFFYSDVYFRLDQRTFRISEAQPSYPRSSKVMWFGCTSYKPDSRNIRKLGDNSSPNIVHDRQDDNNYNDYYV